MTRHPSLIHPLLLFIHHHPSRSSSIITRLHLHAFLLLPSPLPRHNLELLLARRLLLLASLLRDLTPALSLRRRRARSHIYMSIAAAAGTTRGCLPPPEKLLGKSAAVHGLRIGIHGLGDDLGFRREGEKLLEEVVH